LSRLVPMSYSSDFRSFVFSMRPPPTSTLFPYTTLFRSILDTDGAEHDPRRCGRAFLAAAPVPSVQHGDQRRPEHRAGQHRNPTRSEEHTSELQSRENLVCRLLLEKKKS